MFSTSYNNDDNGDRGDRIVAIVGSLTGITAAFVGARLYVRFKMLRSIGLDDSLIILALMCAFVNLGITSAAVAAGSGRHFDTLTLEQKQDVIKYTIAVFCPGILSFAIPKLAVVALLVKIMNPSRGQQIFLWVSSGVTTVALLVCVIILYAQCTPSRALWDFSIERQCWPPEVMISYAIFSGALSAAMDLYLAVYPACVLFSLQMKIQKKVGLSIALGIGSMACIVAAYKCTRMPAMASEDFSYATADVVVWTCIEGSTIIVASCIPILQPLVKLLSGSDTFSSTRHCANHSHRYARRGHMNDSEIALASNFSSYGKSYTRTKIGLSHSTQTGSEDTIFLEPKRPAESLPRPDGQRIGTKDKIRRIDEVTIFSSPAQQGTRKGWNSLEPVDRSAQRHTCG